MPVVGAMTWLGVGEETSSELLRFGREVERAGVVVGGGVGAGEASGEGNGEGIGDGSCSSIAMVA